MPKTARRYFILDVFTDEALAGNPLAVVLDAEDLSDERMQLIAKEFNLSETVFVTKPQNNAHSAALRIFTPARELPFAGHPTVGTAVLLGIEQFGDVDDDMDCMMMLEEKIGLVRARVKVRPDYAGYANFDVPKISETEPVTLGSKDEIAAALGLHINDIGFENHVPSAFSAGVPFAMVPVKDLNAMARITPVTACWSTAFGSGAHNAVYIYTRETVRHGSSFHCRMFTISGGLREDPATGSAAAAFAGAICQFDKPGNGTNSFVLEQGFEMGRSSILELELDIEQGDLVAERLGGGAVVVATGELFV